MPDDAATPGSGYVPFGGVSAVALPSSAQELYDGIMQGIEPDLVTAQLLTLDEKYRDETPEEARQRAERYARAFARYDAACAKQVSSWNGNLRVRRQAALHRAERSMDDEERGHLQSLDDQISPHAS